MRKTQTPAPIVVETIYGTMEFADLAEGFVFRETVCAQPWFPHEERPRNVQQAVEMHLAYQEGGITEVRALLRERRQAARDWEIAREQRYAMARLAPRDSYEYRTHFDMSHPGYLWGG